MTDSDVLVFTDKGREGFKIEINSTELKPYYFMITATAIGGA